MFPSAQACSLRYKTILFDCRKQSREMEMHCVTLRATSGYLFGWVFLCFFLWESPSLHLAWSAGGKKPALSCGLLSLQGRIASRPSHPRTHTALTLSSSYKQKATRGSQLVHLTFDTLPLVLQ